MSDAGLPEIPDVPPLGWLGQGRAIFRDGVLTMTVEGQTDWFNDPGGPTRLASAPALVFPADGDCQLSARVAVNFTTTFDAGVLFVRPTLSPIRLVTCFFL